MQLVLSVVVGTIVGILITIPLGPITIFAAQCTLNGETRKGLYTAAGSVLIDVLYCLVITLGLISLVAPYLHNIYVRIGLTIILIIYGLKMLLVDTKKSPAVSRLGVEQRIEGGHFHILIGAMMALANPTLFLTWTAILSFLSAHGLLSDYFWDKILFSFATGLGSALWFLGLLLFVHSNRHTISPKFLRRIGVATAIVIIGFGVYFSVTIFQQMSGTA